MGASTETKNVFSQPARVVIGDPTQAGGAGLVELDIVTRVTIQLLFFRQISPNELGQMLADGVFRTLQGVRVSLQLMRAQASIIAALFAEAAVVATDGIKFTTDLANVTPPTMGVIPLTSYGDGVSSKFNWWLPAVDPVDVSEFVHKLEAGNGGDPYTINFDGLLRETDHAGQAMLDGYKLVFRDTPTNAVTPNSPADPWALPAGY